MRTTQILVAVIIGIISILNYIVVDSPEISEKYTLDNIEALQANAGEMHCDQANDSSCTITVGGVTGRSTGNLIWEL